LGGRSIHERKDNMRGGIEATEVTTPNFGTKFLVKKRHSHRAEEDESGRDQPGDRYGNRVLSVPFRVNSPNYLMWQERQIKD
jgi:hypothetical protein